MNKIKLTMGAGAASFALMLGLAVPALAVCDGTSNSADCSTTITNIPTTITTDNSVVLGDCSINGDVTQTASVTDLTNDADGAADGSGGSGGDGGTGGNATGGGGALDSSVGGAGGTGGTGGSASGTVGQSIAAVASNTLSLTCTTNNVTNNHTSTTVAAATSGGRGAAAQVVAAPVGGVKAGAGIEASSVTSILGMGGSLATMSLGMFLRKRA